MEHAESALIIDCHFTLSSSSSAYDRLLGPELQVKSHVVIPCHAEKAPDSAKSDGNQKRKYLSMVKKSQDTLANGGLGCRSRPGKAYRFACFP